MKVSQREFSIAAPKLPTIEITEKVEFLRSFPLFAELSQPELESLGHVMQELELEPGKALLTQNEPADGVYLLRAGAVKILVNKEMVAGVMPEMREACPRVSGRCLASFWRASMDRAETCM